MNLISLYPWLDTVLSDLNSDFVDPLCPLLDERVTIRLRVAKSAPVSQVWFHWSHDGEAESLAMRPVPRDSHWSWWEVSLPVEQPRISFSFILETPKDGIFFYSRRRITTYHQSQEHDFVILADRQWPLWIPQGVAYQIFPDRFFKGGRQDGVKTGEYRYCGHEPVAMDWDSPPREWKDGFCLDFFNGDLDGIRKKIPYLKELGVTTIFLNPIFCGRSTHRYDCTDYFQVDPHLGGNKALARLSKALHQEGLRLVVDVSLNHTGVDHTWAQKALADPASVEAGYYTLQSDGTLEGWLGVPTLPRLNYANSALRKQVYEGKNSLVKQWLRPPYALDGWRFDVGQFTGNHNAFQLGQEVFRGIRRAVKQTNPEAWIMAEHWTDSSSFLQGDAWDGCMNYFACGRPLRRFLGERDRYIRGGDPKPRLSAEHPRGEDLEDQILQFYTKLPHLIPHFQLNILDSHDHFRFHTFKEAFRWESYRGLVFVQYLLPGTPNLYYGDEVGLDGWAETYEGVRFPMVWNKRRWKKDFVHLYQTMNRLKTQSTALHWGALKVLYASEHVFVLARFIGREAVIGLLNKDPQPSRHRIPVASLGVESAVEVFSGAPAELHDGFLLADLGPRSCRLWTCTLVP